MAEKELSRIIVLEPVTDSVKELVRLIQEKGQAEIMPVTNGDEAAQLALQYVPCILFLSVNDGSEIPQRVGMLKKVEKVIKKGQLKTLCVSKLKNRQLSQLVSGLGVTDYMEEPVQVRTMQFKANLQLKAIETIRKQEAQKKASEEKIVFKPSEKKKDDPANLKTTENGTKLKPALGISDDTFLFKNSQVKKIGKKVTVELEGPAPETGEWVQHEDKGDTKTSWRWVPEDKKDSPEAKNGDGWVHNGDKPAYNAETKKWQMTSEKPELALQKEGKKVATKISTDEAGEVEVAADSPEAEENLKKNIEIVEKKKAQKAEEQKQVQIKKEADQEAKKQEIKANATAVAAANKEAKEKKIAAKEIEKQKEETVKAEAKAAATAEEAATFNNKLTGEKEAPTEFNNKLGSKETEDPKVVNSNPELEMKTPPPDAAPKKKPINPLDFLKKKKEQAEKNSASPAEREAGFNDKSSEGPAAVHTEIKDKRKLDKSHPNFNALKDRLGEELGEVASENETTVGNAESASSDAEQTEDAQVITSAETPTKTEESKPKTMAAAKARIEKKVAEHKQKIEKIHAERKQVQKKIQEEVNRPIPEKLDPVEEKVLRKKLGLENRPDIAPKELAKRAKLKNLKDLKGMLADLDAGKQVEEKELETNIHDLKKEEIDNTWSEGEAVGGGRKQTKIRAFDSELSDEEKEELERKRKKLEQHEAAAKGKGLRTEEDAHYLPEESIQPIGGAWEATGENYVYLSGDIKYHGFEALKDILPLWIFQGPSIPELQSKSKEWKFLTAIPFQAKEINQIPNEVREYLLGLRDRINKEKDKPNVEETPKESVPEETAEAEGSKAGEKTAKKKNKIDSRLENLKSSLEEETAEFQESEEPVAETDTQEEESSGEDEISKARKKLKEEKEKKREKEAAEAKKLEEEIAQATKKEDSPQDEEALPEPIQKKNKNEDQESSAPEANKKNKNEDQETSAPEANKKKDKAEDAFKSRLDMLKADLEDSANALGEAEAPKEKNQEEVNSESFEKVRAERKPENASTEGIAEKVTEKLGKKSEAIQEFLERRKNKIPKPESPPTENVNSNPYLGIFVALSDAVNPGKNTKRSVMRTIRAIEGSIENCLILVTDADKSGGSSTIRFSVRPDKKEGDKIALEDGLVYPIAKSTEESGLVLGYLYVQALPPKTGFDAVQSETLKKAALLLWPVLAKEENNKASEKKAA